MYFLSGVKTYKGRTFSGEQLGSVGQQPAIPGDIGPGDFGFLSRSAPISHAPGAPSTPQTQELRRSDAKTAVILQRQLAQVMQLHSCAS